MDSLIEKVIVNGGPSAILLVAFYFLVTVFLKHMTSEAERNRELHKQIQAENMASRLETRATIDNLSTSLNKNTEWLNKNTDATTRISMYLENINHRQQQ